MRFPPRPAFNMPPSAFFPSSFLLQLPWRMQCQLHLSSLLNRFWGWWMVRISYPSASLLFQIPPPPGSWHFTCQWMAVSERGVWKRGWPRPAEVLFQFLWMRSAVVRRSWGLSCKTLSVSKPAEALNAHLDVCSLHFSATLSSHGEKAMTSPISCGCVSGVMQVC